METSRLLAPGTTKISQDFYFTTCESNEKIRIEPRRVHIFGMEPKDKSDGKDNTIIINKFKKLICLDFSSGCFVVALSKNTLHSISFKWKLQRSPFNFPYRIVKNIRNNETVGRLLDIIVFARKSKTHILDTLCV